MAILNTAYLPQLSGSAFYAILIVVPFVLLASALAVTRLYTTWEYQRRIQWLLAPQPRLGKQTVTAPQIPYTLPWLGNSLDFLTPKPGAYWQRLFSRHPRSTGVCTLLLGGRPTHILYSPTAIQAMFKDKTMNRDRLEHELYDKVFGLPQSEIDAVEAGKFREAEMNAKYLTRFERVNELTANFISRFDAILAQQQSFSTSEPLSLYTWLRRHMFTASMEALMGDKLLQLYPEFYTDFFAFDAEFLSHFFGFPSFMMKDANCRREKILSRLAQWSALMQAQTNGAPIDPEGPEWETLLGSRLNRARHIDYTRRGLNARSAAALDLGMTFGLSSNVIPATGWMLMHILNPASRDRTLLPRVLAEIRAAQHPNTNPTNSSNIALDVATLVSSPLLQSIWTETLRLYTDVLVTRTATQDTTLPLDDDGKTALQLRRGDDIWAPCWLAHHEPDTWKTAGGVDEFDAARHLLPDLEDPTSARQVFASPKGNNLFAFGGGRTICPGRFFAKQEALGALAVVLLRYEVEVLGFVDAQGKETSAFPGLASAYSGSGGLVPGGDLRVRLRVREEVN